MIKIFTQDYRSNSIGIWVFQYQFQTNSTQALLKIKWQNQYKRTKEIENWNKNPRINDEIKLKNIF